METTSPVNLSIGDIITKGATIGLRNALPLIGATILWLLTLWIPYLNVGTTIGLVSSVVAMSKGGSMSVTEIFDGKYRKYMGEFFLLTGLRQLGIFAGIIFLFVPGIVIAISWSQAVYLLIDKKMNPVEALKVSNDITYGHKWTMFLGIFFLVIIYQVIAVLIMFSLFMSNPVVGGIMLFLLIMLFLPIIFGAAAHIYSVLSQKIS